MRRLSRIRNSFPVGVLDQGGQKLDALVGVECLIDNHPVRLALVRDRGNHRELLTCSTHRIGDRRLAHRGIAAATYISVHQSRLVAPVNLCPFSLGTFLDLGVFLVEPRLNGFGTLFVSLLDPIFLCCPIEICVKLRFGKG